MSKSGTLFTIGYEGRTQDDYLARLREHGVTVLCDVRRNAISRKKGFSASPNNVTGTASPKR